MLVLVGPSASGKTQVVQLLIKNYGMKKMVTYTTRPKRVGEVEGIDYHFLTKEEFQKRILDNFFLEHVIYNGNFYGTSKSSITDDKVVILEPVGLKHYIELVRDKITIIYLKSDEKFLYDRMIRRHDTHEQAMQRLALDKTVFTDELDNLVDYIIDSGDISLQDLTQEVYDKYMQALKNHD